MGENTTNHSVKKSTKFIDMVGEKINHLTIIERAPNTRIRGKTRVRWKCLCDCGNEFVADASNIRSGNTTTCGCESSKNRVGEKSWGWTGVGKMPGSYFSQIRGAAKTRGIEFDVTPCFLWKMFWVQEGICSLSGLPISFYEGARKDCSGKTTASLDRIDSSRGYSTGNVQWVHKRINSMKNDMTETEFIKMCEAVVNHNKKQNEAISLSS